MSESLVSSLLKVKRPVPLYCWLHRKCRLHNNKAVKCVLKQVTHVNLLEEESRDKNHCWCIDTEWSLYKILMLTQYCHKPTAQDYAVSQTHHYPTTYQKQSWQLCMRSAARTCRNIFITKLLSLLLGNGETKYNCWSVTSVLTMRLLACKMTSPVTHNLVLLNTNLVLSHVLLR